MVQSLTKQVQQMRCPEAMYWKTGDLVMVGKGDHAWYFRVVGRQTPTVALVKYVRRAPDVHV